MIMFGFGINEVTFMKRKSKKKKSKPKKKHELKRSKGKRSNELFDLWYEEVLPELILSKVLVEIDGRAFHHSHLRKIENEWKKRRIIN